MVCYCQRPSFKIVFIIDVHVKYYLTKSTNLPDTLPSRRTKLPPLVALTFAGHLVKADSLCKIQYIIRILKQFNHNSDENKNGVT
jgi:predicted MPP superfamily phosphohydrolase